MKNSKLLVIMCVLTLGFTFLPRISYVNGQNTTVREALTGEGNNGTIDPETEKESEKEFSNNENEKGGLGPWWNGRSCKGCHNNPFIGGASKTSIIRSGHWDGDNFEGGVVRKFAQDGNFKEEVPKHHEVVATRITPDLSGNGLIDAVEDSFFRSLSEAQFKRSKGKIKAEYPLVILDDKGNKGFGVFGYKGQQGSLFRMCSEAYNLEIGITTSLFPREFTNIFSLQVLNKLDKVKDIEDANDEDIILITQFVQSRRAPARDAKLAALPETRAGEALFDQIGCTICHTKTLRTAPLGTILKGKRFPDGTSRVPDAIANTEFHPWSDRGLHDIGTGDNIIINGGNSTRKKMRTLDLWNVRFREDFLMHDGKSDNFDKAIRRHRGVASEITSKYEDLDPELQKRLINFLKSL